MKQINNQTKIEDWNDWLVAFEMAGQVTGRSQNKVWYDHIWDKNICSEQILHQRLNHSHCNSAQAGPIEDPSKYPYSS